MTSPTPEMKELSTDWQDKIKEIIRNHNDDDMIEPLCQLSQSLIDASYKRGRDETIKECKEVEAARNMLNSAKVPDEVGESMLKQLLKEAEARGYKRGVEEEAERKVKVVWNDMCGQIKQEAISETLNKAIESLPKERVLFLSDKVPDQPISIIEQNKKTEYFNQAIRQARTNLEQLNQTHREG